jgi:hypothetical protein
MNIVEASKKAENVIGGLFVSIRKEQIEDVFSRNGIEDRMERVQLLRECMNVIGASNSGDPLSPEDEYSDELEIFLDGKWRLL